MFIDINACLAVLKLAHSASCLLAEDLYTTPKVTLEVVATPTTNTIKVVMVVGKNGEMARMK